MSEKKKGKTTQTLKSVYRYFLGTAWKEQKLYFLARALKAVTTTLEPFIAIIFLPKIIEELMGERDASRLLQYAGTIVLMNFLVWILSALFGAFVDYYAQKFENYYTMVLSKKIMELDFMKTEDKKALDQLELAKNGMSWYSGGMNGLIDPLFNVISSILTLVGVFVIIIRQAPMVFVITLVILIFTTIINARLNRIEETEYAKLSKINRIFGYLGWELADFRYGADVRLYNAGKMLVEKYSSYTKKMTDRMEQLANKQLPLQLLSMLSDVVRDFGTYFYLGVLAITEKITIATTSQMITAAGTFSGSTRNIILNLQIMVKRSGRLASTIKCSHFQIRKILYCSNILMRMACSLLEENNRSLQLQER